MKRIILTSESHRGAMCIFFRFEKSDELLALARKNISNFCWSKTMSSWYTPVSNFDLKSVIALFQGIAYIDFIALEDSYRNPIKQTKSSTEVLLSDEVVGKIMQFKKYLLSRRYSENTIKTYVEALITFLKFFHDRALVSITNEDIIRFNNEYILEKKLSQSYQNQVINALKLFARIIEGNRLEPEIMHRPRSQKLLPNVLSKQEVKLIINAPTNMKHRMMLSLIYACGLRRSELLNLKTTDIISDRMLIHIRQSKGKKDRVVPLSSKILENLRAYYLRYRPKNWLFEGQVVGEKYSERSLELILKKSIKLAKIQKPVTLHWLRHSYATHLLESGTDLRFIQELLGHTSSRTTEIYTHVSTKSIQQVRSPFDDL